MDKSRGNTPVMLNSPKAVKDKDQVVTETSKCVQTISTVRGSRHFIPGKSGAFMRFLGLSSLKICDAQLGCKDSPHEN